MVQRTAAGLAALVLLAAACGGGGADGVDVGGPDDGADPGGSSQLTSLPLGAWVLEEGRGQEGAIDVPDGSRVTMLVEQQDDGSLAVSGTAACNGYGGSVQLDDDAWRTQDLAWTEMGCAPELMVAEQAYLRAFEAVDTWQRDELVLTLTGQDDVLLGFGALDATANEAYEDRTWVLDGLVEGTGDGAGIRTTAPGADAAELFLGSDGRVHATTGCRVFEGDWTTSGDEVLFVPSFGEAPGSPSVADCDEDTIAQEQQVLSVLGDGFVPTVDGDRLTLTDGPLGLVYRLADGRAPVDDRSGDDGAVAPPGGEQECHVADYSGEEAVAATLADAVASLQETDLPAGVVPSEELPDPAPIVRVDLLLDGAVVGGVDLAQVTGGWAPLSYDVCLPLE